MIAYCISRRQEPYGSDDCPIGWFAIEGLLLMGLLLMVCVVWVLSELVLRGCVVIYILILINKRITEEAR